MTDTHAAFEHAAPLAEFTLDFAKAMLRTGYYAPDHPQAQQSRAGLYEKFRRVLEDRPGLTYQVGMEGDRRTVLIDGYDPGPLALDKIMIRGMAELFTPKLLEFFDRRHLLSFSLRAAIMPVEFNAFVILMSEPPTAGRAQDERERVTQAFLDQQIVNVSTLFEADVVGRERRLTWRVERALSRLGRDLRMLPLYRHASEEKIQEIKIQIIDDVIRPLRTPRLLADLLVNCDVLARDIRVLKEAQIEHEVIAQVPTELLTSTTRQMVEDLRELDAAGGPDAMDLANRHRLLIRDLLHQLVRTKADVEGELLQEIVGLEIYTEEELPKRLQQAFKRHHLFQAFLAKSGDYLKHLSHLPTGKTGMQLAALAQLVFPELLRRGHYGEAAGVLEALHSGHHQNGAAQAVQALTDSLGRVLAAEETARQLLDALGDEQLDKPDRDALVVLLSFSGTAVAAGLLEIYAATQSLSIRSSAFEAMKRIGRPALEPFLARLSEIEPEWSGVHHVLAALHDQSDPELADSIKPFLQHENAHVRQAALARVFELLEAAAEDHLIEALDDPDPATRHAAVAFLGKLQSRDRRAVAFYTGALHPEDAADAEPEHDEVLVEVCRSLAGLGEAPLPDSSTVEHILLDALRMEGRKKRISGIFHKRPALHSERVRIAICQALGTLGTPATGDALRELAASETEAVAQAAQAAAAQIRERSPS